MVVATVTGYSNAREWDKFPNQKSAPIHLEAGRYYIEALWKDGTGGDNCSVAWQGPGMPAAYPDQRQPISLPSRSGPTVPDRSSATRTSRTHPSCGGRPASRPSSMTSTSARTRTPSPTPRPPTAAIYRGQQALDQHDLRPGRARMGQDLLLASRRGQPRRGRQPLEGRGLVLHHGQLPRRRRHGKLHG